MNKILVSFLFMGLATLFSCNKEVTPEPTLAPYTPAQTDSSAGTWKPVLLDNVTSIIIPAPDSITSASYRAQLDSLKKVQGALTKTQRGLVDEWKSSAIIRWNELARGLVAEDNLPPVYNPDGTYPVPNPAAPGIYPYFPFSNPPYASRAYAYLSVALYDGLVTCWYNKFKYGRAAPYKNDPGVKQYVLDKRLPSYPSEDATIATIASGMLKKLFPNDSVQIKQMALEEEQAAFDGGAAVREDIDAGNLIGKAVLSVALGRFKTDNMSKALGTASTYATLQQNAMARGTSTLWQSQDLPQRPGMLPLFGNVTGWLLDSAIKVSLRPPSPPPVGSVAFQSDFSEVKNYAEHPASAIWSIADRWSDGMATYTPAGHWNAIASDLIVKSKMSDVRTARVLSLLNRSLCDAGICCWDAKYYYYFPRPSQIDPSIKTIGIPNFPSYPSGHSTFSGAAATILGFLFPADATNLQAMADEASNSRVYGCIHYRFDCTAGMALGNAIGGLAITTAKNDGAN